MLGDTIEQLVLRVCLVDKPFRFLALRYSALDVVVR